MINDSAMVEKITFHRIKEEGGKVTVFSYFYPFPLSLSVCDKNKILSIRQRNEFLGIQHTLDDPMWVIRRGIKEKNFHE